MRVIAIILLLSLISVSCGTTEDSRYRDTAMLERPPTLPITRQRGEQTVIDDSVIPKKQDEDGLGSDVSMVESKPMHIIIKKPFDSAWRVLGLALKQSRIKITDHEQDKGLYYVSYKPKSFIENAASIFTDTKEKEDEDREANYLLTVKDDGAETKVFATAINPAQQDNSAESDNDHEEALLIQLYEFLQDDFKEE